MRLNRSNSCQSIRIDVDTGYSSDSLSYCGQSNLLWVRFARLKSKGDHVGVSYQRNALLRRNTFSLSLKVNICVRMGNISERWCSIIGSWYINSFQARAGIYFITRSDGHSCVSQKGLGRLGISRASVRVRWKRKRNGSGITHSGDSWDKARSPKCFWEHTCWRESK